MTRTRLLLTLVLVPAACLAGGSCGDDDLGDGRAAQARTAALDVGLDEQVADFLGLAARGPVATYQATYPGPDAGSEVVVANRPPDRRVDVVADDVVVETRLVLDGQAWVCPRDADAGAVVECERTDAVVEGPGALGAEALAGLTDSLAARTEDFTFAVETAPVAGVEATCLVTTIREGHRRPELAEHGILCVSPEGALLRVEQADETLEATDYTTDIPDNTFSRPDRTADG